MSRRLETVLLVDDEPDIRRIGELTLRAVGKLNVLLAASGLEAIELVLRERPDLVLLDVVMPGLDGPETFARLRALDEGRDLPVIFLTARSHAAEVDRLRALGATGVLAKPFDPMTLPARVREIFAAAQG